MAADLDGCSRGQHMKLAAEPSCHAVCSLFRVTEVRFYKNLLGEVKVLDSSLLRGGASRSSVPVTVNILLNWSCAELGEDDDATVVFSDREDGTVEDVDEEPPESSEASASSPSSSNRSSPSDGSATSEGASSSGASPSTPEMTLAGEDMRPLVELLAAKEGDEEYALGTSWGTYQKLPPMKRRWQVVRRWASGF